MDYFLLESKAGLKGSQHTCPQCGRMKEFTRYIRQSDGAKLPDHVGICNRLSKCGYKFSPSEYFRSGGVIPRSNTDFNRPQTATRAQSYHNHELVKESLWTGEDNNLVRWLRKVSDRADDVMLQYRLGIFDGCSERVIFWQLDQTLRACGGKVMTYEPTGHRKKTGNTISWVHHDLNVVGFHLKQCLFGLHLLSYYPDRPIAIVESEKTALVASCVRPGITWMATGGAQGLSRERLLPLSGRKIALYPDTGSEEMWKSAAAKTGLPITFVHKTTPGGMPIGSDLADYVEAFMAQRVP